MGARQRKGGLFGRPMFNAQERAGEPSLSRQAEFSFAHGGRVSERISESPDFPPQSTFDLELLS